MPVVDGTGTVVPGSVNVLVLWTVVGEATLEDDFALDEPGAAVDAPGGGRGGDRRGLVGGVPRCGRRVGRSRNSRRSRAKWCRARD